MFVTYVMKLPATQLTVLREVGGVTTTQQSSCVDGAVKEIYREYAATILSRI